MPRPVSVTSVHSVVRRATARLHARIDQTSILAALMRRAPDLPTYTSAMVALEAAYRPLDFILSGSGPLCPAEIPAYVPRGPGITRDLISLQVALPGRDIPFWLQAPQTRAAYLGMRYVVEGAQLGGRIIYSHLLESFGDRVPEFASFWIPNPNMQASWPAVMKALAQVECRSCIAAAARSARLTFRHMEQHLAFGGTEIHEPN